MEKFLTVFLLMIAINAKAQNVGINNANPAQALDVTGNVNVTGSILANGVSGTPNQVLMKNSTGDMQWGDLGEYKNYQTHTVSGTFTVPAGVTKIEVELWGGGGGGNAQAGGGSGGYIRAQFYVSPGSVGTYSIATGGGNALYGDGGNGSITNFNILGNSANAFGGNGALYSNPTTYNVGYGAATPTASNKNYIAMPGTNGTAVSTHSEQRSATVFYEYIKGGSGGVAYKATVAAGCGDEKVVNLSTATEVQYIFRYKDGRMPGGGGGSGLFNTVGGQGGPGMIIIYY